VQLNEMAIILEQDCDLLSAFLHSFGRVLLRV
jgi:hypothetical protein